MDHHHQDKATQVSLDDDDDGHDEDDGGRPPPPEDSSLITGQLLDIVAKVLISILSYILSILKYRKEERNVFSVKSLVKSSN